MALKQQHDALADDDHDVGTGGTSHRQGQERAFLPLKNIGLPAVLGICLSLALIAGVTFWFWPRTPDVDALLPQTNGAMSQRFTVTAQEVVTHIDIVGTIMADQSQIVSAPFDGHISTVSAGLGFRVQEGEVLAAMDTVEIANKLRDAEAGHLRARMAVDALKNWDSGPQIQSAKRALQSAQQEFATLEAETETLSGLFERGLVSRNEYEASVRRRDRQSVSVQDREQELHEIYQRGGQERLHLAQLELMNAQARFEVLQKQIQQADLTAPVAGVLTSPPSRDAEDTPFVKPGIRVTEGHPLFSIANTNTLIISGLVDEVDVNSIRIGQPVDITGDAFPDHVFSGTVDSIGAEAVGTVSSGRPPSFEIRAKFQLKDMPFADRVRLGMSARMRIKTYINPKGLIIPIEAVHSKAERYYVTLMSGISNKDKEVPVTLGVTIASGVEVTSGLEAGDQILLPQSPI